MGLDIIEVNIFVSPFEIMNDSLISELFLNNEDILEEVYDSLLNVKVIKLSYHSLLIFQVFLICVNQSVSFINNSPYVIENASISTSL